MGQLSLALPKPKKKPKLGRPRKYRRGDERHAKRPRFARRTVVHVTLKVIEAVRTLRRRSAYQAVNQALVAICERSDFRVCHVSLERDHIHLLVEADDDRALSRGMQAFQIAAAQYLNQVISSDTSTKRTGTVFIERYHARLVTSPTQAHRALNYVLNNWRKHGQDRRYECADWEYDYFSSAPSFEGWLEHGNEPCFRPWPRGYEPLTVFRPRTWLLRTGWRKAGTISLASVPGSG